MIYRSAGKASAAWAQIVVSSSAGVGIGPKQVKSVRDGFDDTPGGFEAAAFLGDVIGDVFQVRLGAFGEAVCHLAGRFLLRRNPGAGALHDAVGKLAHGFARDFGALAMCKRGFRVVERFPEFGTRALPLLPEREGFLHSVFGVLKPARLDGLADERFLVGARTDFHVIKGSTARLRVKATGVQKKSQSITHRW